MTTKQSLVVRAFDENIFTLPMNKKDEKPPTKSMTPPPKRITKATEKKIMRRAQASKVVKPSAKSPQPVPEKEYTISEYHDHNQKPLERLFGKNVEEHNNDNSFQSEHVDIDKKSIFNQ